MSSILKRVPLDFQWPLHQVWEGYQNPHGPESHECSLCKGSGYSPFAHALFERWYGYRAFKPQDNGSTPFLPTDKKMVEVIEPKVARDYEFYRESAKAWKQGASLFTLGDMYRSTLEEFEAKWGVVVDREAFAGLDLAIQCEAIRMCNIYNGSLEYHLNDEDVQALVGAGRLMELTHDFVPGQGWSPKEPAVVPSAHSVNEWALFGMGHDSLNLHVVITARCEKAGQLKSCLVCDGEGDVRHFSSDDQRARFESWEPYEPPVGEGYQYWETISEGAPVSPVFASKTDLAQWLHLHRNHNNLSRHEWLKVLDEGGAGISMIMAGGQMYSGEQAIAKGLLNENCQ